MASAGELMKIQFNGEKWQRDMGLLKEVFERWAEVVRTSLIFAELARDIHRLEVKLVHTKYRQKRGKRW